MVGVGSDFEYTHPPALNRGSGHSRRSAGAAGAGARQIRRRGVRSACSVPGRFPARTRAGELVGPEMARHEQQWTAPSARAGVVGQGCPRL